MGLDCFDTNSLIQFVQAIDDPNLPHAPNWHAYLKEVEDGKHTLALPAPVVAEYLVGIPEAKWSEVIELFQKQFQIHELNLRASLEAARMMRTKLEKDGKLGSGNERECVRTDAFILGIAVAIGSDRLFSSDDRIQALADGRIKIENEPNPAQSPLF